MKSNSRLRPRGSISPRTLHPACSSQCTVCTWASRLSVAPCCDRPVDHIGVGSQDSAIVVRRDRLAQTPGPGQGIGPGTAARSARKRCPRGFRPWSRAQLLLPANLAVRRCRPGLPTPLAALPPRWPLPSAQQPEITTCGGQVHLGGSWRALIVFY